ncbi:MAG TPA: YraN family protein [Mycobacteriales bacterium]|nr:YraN family protein [Mycobacteriales bacterium]
MAAKDGVGRYGEDVAVRHLEEAGLEILARNWRCSEGEIDIVARDRGVVVICEVKTRSGLGFGLPAEAITRRKADRLRRLAYHWLREHPARGADIRFDVISVLRAQRGAAVVEHLRAAF